MPVRRRHHGLLKAEILVPFCRLLARITALWRVILAAVGRVPTTISLVLFALVLQPATALAVDGDGETTFTIPFKGEHGLSVKLEADDDEIELKVSKRGQQAVYFAPGEVTPEGVAVKFGAFGGFVVGYVPFRTLEEHGPNRHCEGEPITTTEGFFRGTMRFRGEDGYFNVEASRAKGTLVLQPEWKCDYGRAGASRARGRDRGKEKATLVAASRRDRIQFSAIGARRKDERPFTYFFVVNQEVTEGVGISRFTYAVARSADFEFDTRRGTASVHPPAPFAGSAYYVRRSDAPDRWSGSLTAPLLGLGRIRLVGPDFRAAMVRQLPEFE